MAEERALPTQNSYDSIQSDPSPPSTFTQFHLPLIHLPPPLNLSSSPPSAIPPCIDLPIMDPIPWDQVKTGDLDVLRVALFSSSTSRRLRALQELRDKGKLDLDLTSPRKDIILIHLPFRDRYTCGIPPRCPRPTLPNLSPLH
jgi:hypothetical protein